ncbi:MAG TPA: glycosyl hydrolase [Candidatus Omnitrophota bacterium]|nr:glycosyl hydrolase [Candidatus Omnitrophota bacterium]
MIRRKICVLFCVLFLTLAVAGHGQGREPGAGFVPSQGRVLVIGQQKDSMEIYIKEFGTVPAGFMIYTSIQELNGLEQPDDKGAGVGHGQYWVDTYPGTVLQVGLYLVGALPEILSGQYDDHLRKMGEWILRTRRPVYLRIGYEFDNKDNQYDPKLYQQAFRYIVEMFQKQGVTNTAFVWHSTAYSEGGVAVMDWYPGDAYVDWFGVSFFSTQQRSQVEAFCRLAREHGKPVMIAESAPAGLYTTRGKLEWLKHFFDLIEKEDIKIVSYINSDWDKLPMFAHMKWGNSRLHRTKELRDYWLSRVQNSSYLVCSPELFMILGFSSIPLK